MELRSSYFTGRPETAPHRSLLKACGFTNEELSKPLIAVVSAHSEIVPGHINLDKITAAVKAGVSAAGGTVVQKACVLAEGGAADRDDIVFLATIPIL